MIAWRRHSEKWSALVVRIDESGQGTRVIQDWLPYPNLDASGTPLHGGGSL